MQKTRSIVIILVFVLKAMPVLQLNAQDLSESHFALYTQKDGLSNNFVTSIEQDSYGYIWVSTRKGLNRFDGNQFINFYSDSNSNSLPQDHISLLKNLANDQLAVITQTGLFIMTPKTLKGKNLVIPPGELKYRYKVNSAMDVVIDENKNLCLLTRSGLYTFDPNYKLISRYDHYKKEDVDKTPFSFASKLAYIATEKQYIISTINGLFSYDPNKKAVAFIDSNGNSLLSQLARETAQIRILHTNDSSIFLFEGGVRELVYYDFKKKVRESIRLPFVSTDQFDWRTKFYPLNDSVFAITSKQQGFFLIHYRKSSGKLQFDSTLYFGNYHCSSLYKDNQGHLWIGTNRGLLRSRTKTASVQKMVVPKEFNPKDRDLQFRSCQISNKKLFVGSWAGEGVFVFAPESGQLIKKINISKYSDASNHVTSLISVHQDTIYAGTNGPLIWINTRNYSTGLVPLPNWDKKQWVPIQFKDSRGNVYVGNSYAGQYYFRDASTKNFRLIDEHENPFFKILTPRFISEDPNGNIWFSGHGISRLNRSSGQFDRMLDSFPRRKTDRRETISPTFDDKGNLYVGLVENGVGIYNPDNNSYRQLTRSDGLPDNNIIALQFIAGKLWIGTESGIASYDVGSERIEAYSIADDMPEGSYSGDHFYFDSTSSQMYGLFSSTIVKFNPSAIAKNNVPPVYFIEQIQVGSNKTIFHPSEEIRLGYKENNLVINQASINFSNPEQQQYAYRFVKNGDEAWQLTGNQKNIILSNLLPGKHHLQVKTFVSNNSWPAQIRDIYIYIKPPFWQTTWFPVFVGTLLVVGLFLIYRRRVKRIHQKANIDKQLAELEMKGLHAQMNPHFIFNSLNSIKEMILENEKTNASRYLSKFAQLIRTNLEQSRQTFITVRQCIDHLVQYFEMEKIRFEEFSYDIRVEDQLSTDMIKMAPMLLQPLVENAIWHGLKSKEGEKRIVVRFSEINNYLVCEIDDNGIGIKQSSSMTRQAHRSLGISNIRQRLAVLNEKYGMDCTLDIFDKSELPGMNTTGTLAILRITLNNASYD